MISDFIEGKVTIFPEISEDFCVCANDGSGILFLWFWKTLWKEKDTADSVLKRQKTPLYSENLNATPLKEGNKKTLEAPLNLFSINHSVDGNTSGTGYKY